MKKELYIAPSIEVIETKAEALLVALSDSPVVDPTGTETDNNNPSIGGPLSGALRYNHLWEDDEEGY